MKVELPELKRCCFCIPLRYGLIAWGYIKLGLLLLFSVFATALLVVIVRHITTSEIPAYIYIEDIVMTSLVLLLMLVDICFTILFLVGGHRKSARLIHICYIYNIVFICIFALLFTIATAVELVIVGRYVDHMPHGFATFIPIIQTKVLLGVGSLGTQMYIILLLRSEVNKLRNNSKYRFTNPTAGEPTLENGISDLGVNFPKGIFNENGNDNQFEEVIDKNKEESSKDFYN